jgi:peptidoglycan/xylan/chitin deacetylase (PgdA/CDA1 family)
MNIKDKVQRKIIQWRCTRIFHKSQIRNTINKGIITIYHDYERHYHHKSVIPFSDQGILAILDTEKRFKIISTFNVVVKLIDEVSHIIRKIRKDGHGIASHSYSHNIMPKLNEDQINKDIELSKLVFLKHGLKMSGLRSPQSRWCFPMLPIMLNHGLMWSAENDRADYPYVIYRNKYRKLLRMPIKMDDWDYEENKITPNQMHKKLIHCVDLLAEKKIYGAIGFHPWVQGKNDERIKVFRDFIEYVAKNKKIIILSFDGAYDLFKKIAK